MKLKLSKRQVDLIKERHIFGIATQTKTMADLVERGIFRDTGDKTPFFDLTRTGEELRDLLWRLEALGMVDP